MRATLLSSFAHGNEASAGLPWCNKGDALVRVSSPHAILSGGMLREPISCDCAHWQPALRQPLQCTCVWDPEALTGQRFPGEGVCCAGVEKDMPIVSVLQRYLSILVEKMETVHCAVDQGLHNALIYSGEQSLLHRYG